MPSSLRRYSKKSYLTVGDWRSTSHPIPALSLRRDKSTPEAKDC